MNAPIQSRMFDSLLNLISGLGTAKDKTVANVYGLALLDQMQLDNAYRGDWVARKVVDIPAMDATKKWRSWQASGPQLQQLDDEERRLGLRRKVKTAMIKARLYGGSAIVIGTGDADPSKELVPDSVKQGGIKYLHVASRYEIVSGLLNWDLLGPIYGLPEYYESRSYQGAGPVRIHPSRIVRFLGNELADVRQTADGGWGDSVLQALDDAIKNVGSTSQSIATMVAEAKVDVIRIPNLMANVSTKSYRDKFMERMSLASTSKSLLNTLVMDKEEEWERIKQEFGGLPFVLELYLTIACGAADIPATRFIGQAPKGLNSTGEGDTRNYYDMISSHQETELGPALESLDEMLIRSATGTRDKQIFYEWNPLWNLDDVQRATIAKAKADAFKIDFDAGLIDLDALREGRENQLIEDGTYPGLEEALAQAELLAQGNMQEGGESLAQFNITKAGQAKQPSADPNAVDPKTGLPVKTGPAVAKIKKTVGADAEPRSLYVRRDVLNAGDILAWARSQGLQNTLPASEMHVTILYSKNPVDWMKLGDDYGGMSNENGGLTIQPGGPRIVELFGPGAGDTVVLSFSSTMLQWRHQSMVDKGASHDYPEYLPHVSVAKIESGDFLDLSKIEPYRGKIVLGPEIFEEIQ